MAKRCCCFKNVNKNYVLNCIFFYLKPIRVFTYCYENRNNVISFNTNKYIELVPSKQTTTSMREKGIDK